MTNLSLALDFIETAENTATMDELQQHLSTTLQQFGVTQFSLITLMERPGGKARAPIGLTRATNPDWSERYYERKYFNSDAVIHHAMRQSNPFDWNDLNARTLAVGAKTMLDEARDCMKVDGCFVVPTHDARGFAGLISMFHPGPSPDAGMRKALKLITIYAIERAKELHGLQAEAPREDVICPLTPRQRECLALSAVGKSDGEIGTILGRAESTVNHHFERAKKLLDVATRAQAVAIAVYRGWIVL